MAVRFDGGLHAESRGFELVSMTVFTVFFDMRPQVPGGLHKKKQSSMGYGGGKGKGSG
jgi:hypothetical protein